MIDRIIEFSAANKFIVLLLIGVLTAAGIWSMYNVPLDAIPDLSDTQVIVYSRWDRSPDIMEDQVTYPIVTSMLAAPKVKTVRGFSDFGYSYVYIIFEEGTDIYRARQLVYRAAGRPVLCISGRPPRIGSDHRQRAIHWRRIRLKPSRSGGSSTRWVSRCARRWRISDYCQCS